MADGSDRPVGRAAVRAALIDATTELILEQGVAMSVREIARRADVNHGLVHTYFGSREALLTEAFGAVIARAAADVDPAGFPPPDLASRRSGELAKTIARVMLEVDDDPFPEHPILPGWHQSLVATHTDAAPDELAEAVIVASTLGLGWALFSDYLCRTLDLDDEQRAAVEQRVVALIAEIGMIPSESGSTSSEPRPSE